MLEGSCGLVIHLNYLFLANWGPCLVLNSPTQQALVSVLVTAVFFMVVEVNCSNRGASFNQTICQGTLLLLQILGPNFHFLFIVFGNNEIILASRVS